MANNGARMDAAKWTARSETITSRDDRLFRALFFCRYLNTTEIAALFFNSKSAARRRLPQLQHKGYIEGRSLYITMSTWDRPGKKENVYHLTKKGFETVTESLKLYEEKYVSKQLGQKGAVHHVKAAEVYVTAQADLDEILGPYPEWEWLHEKKAEDSYHASGIDLRHQPDAHVVFANHTFVIERQTRESRIGVKGMEEKVSGHATWARKRTDEPENVEVLFACDDKRVAEQAERAGKRYGIDVVGGSVEEIAYYLYQSALRLVPEPGEPLTTS